MTVADDFGKTDVGAVWSGQHQVYIILVNWNGSLDTIECLESVFRLRYRNYRVVVCDNDSSDGSIGDIAAWAEGRTMYRPPETPMGRFTDPPITKPLEYRLIETEQRQGFPRCFERLIILPTGGNLGFAGGNNVGIRFALSQGDCDFLWLLNNDTVVDPDSLARLVKKAGEDGSLGMVGATIRYYDRPDIIQALGGARFSRIRARSRIVGIGRPISDYDIGSLRRVEELLDWICGASMFLPKRFLETVGMMEEQYFLYFEELDWVFRAKGLFRLGYSPDAVVYHKQGVATKEKWQSPESSYYKYRSRLKFYRKFLPLHLPFCLLATAVEAMVQAGKGNIQDLRPMWRSFADEFGRKGF
ncbi:MAG: glycosyltransferase family 2 protein [Candidatus Deferrimicrobium sp.]